MKLIKSILTASVIAMTVVLFTTAQASDEVNRTHSVSTTGVTQVEIQNGVGAIYVTPSEGDTLTAEVKIEGSRTGIFRKVRDVSDSDIQIDRSGNKLVLSFKEDNAKATWHIQLPAVDALSVNLGVGHVDIEVLDTAVDVNNGVGDVIIKAPLEFIGEVAASAGVGSANISGSENAQSKRSVVSERSDAVGYGDKRISVEIGVGDAQVRLK